MSTMRRLAILISGGGSTMDAVFAAVQDETLIDIEPVVVISSDAGAAGLKKAAARGGPTAVIERKSFSTQTAFGEEILKTLTKSRADLVAQLGWLPLTPKNVIEEYEDDIFNQHPGPLDPGRPDFGGKGMFGIHVDAAVLAYQTLTGQRFPTEATTHMVTEEFDRGRVISTARLDTQIIEDHAPRNYFEDPANLKKLQSAAEMLQKELLPLEHQNVIKTIQTIADGTPYMPPRHKPLIPQKNLDMLGYSKMIAAGIM